MTLASPKNKKTLAIWGNGTAGYGMHTASASLQAKFPKNIMRNIPQSWSAISNSMISCAKAAWSGVTPESWGQTNLTNQSFQHTVDEQVFIILREEAHIRAYMRTIQPTSARTAEWTAFIFTAVVLSLPHDRDSTACQLELWIMYNRSTALPLSLFRHHHHHHLACHHDP